MIELKINLPGTSAGYRISAVYKITFDDGKFYIGASVHLRSRAYGWKGLMASPDRLIGSGVGEAMVERITTGGAAILEILELCAPDEVVEREAFHLHENRSNLLMVSSGECGWKPVLQVRVSDGHFIKRHDSIKAAARFNSCGIGKIQRVLSGGRSSYKGMKYVYEAEYLKPKRALRKNSTGIKKGGRMIIQNDLEGVKIAEYKTLVAAGKSTGVSPTTIKMAIAGDRKTAGGFAWKFE